MHPRLHYFVVTSGDKSNRLYIQPIQENVEITWLPVHAEISSRQELILDWSVTCEHTNLQKSTLQQKAWMDKIKITSNLPSPQKGPSIVTCLCWTLLSQHIKVTYLTCLSPTWSYCGTCICILFIALSCQIFVYLPHLCQLLGMIPCW